MTSNTSRDDSERARTEKFITTKPVQRGDKAGAVGPEKATPEAETTVPGWTIMRPLRLRGLKSKPGGGVPVASADSRPNGVRTKGDSEIKAMETHGSGNGLGEVEALHEVRSDDGLLGDEEEGRNAQRLTPGEQDSENIPSDGVERTPSGHEFKVYKRRWFGLVQLVLLNIVVSWDWLTFSANSTTVSKYYNVTPSDVNWFSTGFLFAFVAISPLVIFILHRGGPKPSIIIASVFILLGNWIRYGATRSGKHGNFGGVMFGQILTGLAQPFVLAAPTRYSDLWFTNRGRVAATAVMSLANPFGGALAQLIDPFWATNPADIPNMVLYIAIISSIASIPSFFIPAAPPTPASASGHDPKQPLLPSLKYLFSSPEFYMVMIPFTLYVGLFNSISSLVNQMLQPYSFSETDAGIAGALLIVVGLVTAAITSPIVDRTKSYLIAIKVQVPVLALTYLAFTWAPQSRSIAAPYVVLSIMGAASFSLVPVVLEYLIEITHPVSPEVTSTICWSGGQLLGGAFILISGALRQSGPSDGSADNGSTRPPGNLFKALIFQTVVALAVVPLPLALGCCGRNKGVKMRRVEADKEALARMNTADESVVPPVMSPTL